MNSKIELLKKLSEKAEEQVYPGYPYQLTGTIDFGREIAFFDSYGKEMPLKDFMTEFDSKMAYLMIGSKLVRKGNWYVGETQMADYEKIISFDTDYEDFYIDNLLAVKLYFGLWSAYRKYKGTKALIWFLIDMDCECVDIQVFHTKAEIELYLKELE